MQISPEDGTWFGNATELPDGIARGAAELECLRNTREALAAAVAPILMVGQRPPATNAEGKREQQVKIRLTAYQRTRIEEAARLDGFRSVSDFIRAAAIAKAG